MPMQRIRVAWTGFIGGPGVSTFYMLDAAAGQNSLASWAESMKAYLPPVVSLQVETSGDSIDVATGRLTGGWTGSPQTPSVGSGTAGYTAPAGFGITWITSTILDGHRAKGRTFMVPCSDENFDGSGNVLAVRIAALETINNTLIAAVSDNLLVWHRPVLAQPAYTDRRGKVHKAIVARDGAQAGVTSNTVSSRPVVLTSRRD